MKRSIFLLIAAIIAILIGGISLLFPVKMTEGFGGTSTPLLIFLVRELGAFSLCAGVLNFLVRNDPDSKTLKAIFIFNILYHMLMLPINFFGISQGALSFGQAIPPLIIHLFVGIGSFIYLSKIKTLPIDSDK